MYHLSLAVLNISETKYVSKNLKKGITITSKVLLMGKPKEKYTAISFNDIKDSNVKPIMIYY